MRKFAGIEINSTSVSLLFLTEDSNSYSVSRNLRYLISENSISDIIENISKMISPDYFVSVSFSCSNFFIRNIKVPFISKDKINKILGIELEDHLPVDINLLKTSFKITKDSSVLSFSIYKSFLNEYQKLFKEKGLKTDIITVSGLPYAEELKITDRKILLLYFSDDSSTIFFIDDEGVKYAKSIYGKLEESNYSKKIDLELKLLFTDYFKEKGEEFAAEYAVVSGNLTNPELIEDILEDKYNLKILKDSIYDNIDFKNNPHSALAISGVRAKNYVNFVKKRNHLFHFLTENKTSVKRSGILLSVFLMIFLLNSIYSLVNYSRISQSCDLAMEKIFHRSFPEVKNVRHPYEHMLSKIKGLIRNNPQINTRVKKIDILNEISANLPRSMDVDIIKISVGKGIVSINGQTGSFILVDTIRKKLENIKIFEKVTMSSPSKSRRNSRVNFRLSIILKRI